MRNPAFLIALALTGCDGTKDSGSPDCSAEYVPSVVLSVEDASGAAVSAYTASYSVDGGEAQDCDQDGICGYETAGSFSITVDAIGYAEKTESFEVSEDACHVLTEAVTVTLEAVDCTTEAVPSLIVTLLDGAEQPVSDATIAYTAGDRSGSCESSGSANVFVCGEEIIGDFEITVSAEGFTEHTETVTVQGDAEHCHPVTEEITVNLSPS